MYFVVGQQRICEFDTPQLISEIKFFGGFKVATTETGAFSVKFDDNSALQHNFSISIGRRKCINGFVLCVFSPSYIYEHVYNPQSLSFSPKKVKKITITLTSGGGGDRMITLERVEVKYSPYKQLSVLVGDNAVFNGITTPVKASSLYSNSSFVKIRIFFRFIYFPKPTPIEYQWDFGDGSTAIGINSTHVYKQVGTYEAVLKNKTNNTIENVVTVTVQPNVANVCGNMTISSKKTTGLWNDATSWDLGRTPNSDDVVLVKANHTMYIPSSSMLQLKGLCVEGTLRSYANNMLGNPNDIYLNVGMLHNKGKIRSSNGINGAILGNIYQKATSASNIYISSGHFINDTNAEIIANGKGGDDKPYYYYETGSGEVNALGGDGGNIYIYTSIFENSGTLRSGDGGDAVLFENWTKFVYGNAYGGKGGTVYVSTSNMAMSKHTSTSNVQAGCGGSAHAISDWFRSVKAVVIGRRGGTFWFNYSGKLYDVIAGKGGNASINLGYLGGSVKAGCAGKRIGETEILPTLTYIIYDPTVMEVDTSTHLSDADIIYITGGNDWVMDLKKLTPNAVKANKRIILAIGQNGVIDLRGLSNKVFSAPEQVEIYADTILLDPNISLNQLIDAPSITVNPSKILRLVDLQAPSQMFGEPNENLPVKLTLLNNGATEDSYSIEVKDTQGWLSTPYETEINVAGLRQADLVFNVQIPTSSQVDDELTVKVISKADGTVFSETKTRINVYKPEVITPRNGTEADVAIVLDAHYKIGDMLQTIADTLEKVLASYGITPPNDQATIEWLSQFDENNPLTQSAYQSYLRQLSPENAPLPPVIELITFTDTVQTRIVTNNLGEIIGRIRGLEVTEHNTCALAAVEAVEYAATNLKRNGQLFLAVASTPRKDMVNAIQYLKQRNIKANVILNETCDETTANEVMPYQRLSEETGGLFYTAFNSQNDSNNLILENVLTTTIDKTGICYLYGVDDGKLNDSQFFKINAQTLSVSLLGERHLGYDLESIAIHPNTGKIYSVSGDNASLDKPRGYLYEVTSTGDLIPIGETGFKEIGDLTFVNEELYGHTTGRGIVKINLATGKATLLKDIEMEISGFTSVKKSTDLAFYGVIEQNLWYFNLNTGETHLLCNNIPTEVEAIESVGDVLIFGTHQDASFQLQAFNPSTCQTIIDKSLAIPKLSDIEGLSWNHAACN